MIMTDYLRFLLALIAVLALIMLLAWAARRFRLGGLTGAARPSGRLSVIETLPIDGRQRLILIRRDDREHLLLLGQERSLVIESGVTHSPEQPATAPLAKPMASVR